MISLILKRTSYRGRYALGKVPRADLKLIMASGLHGPTG